MGDLFGGTVGDVGVGGGEMGEDFGSVDALPIEGVMGDFIDAIPA